MNLFRKKDPTTVSSDEGDGHGGHLNKVLNVRDLTFLVLRQLLAAVHLVLLDKLVMLPDLPLLFCM